RRIEIHRSHEITDGIARVAQVSEGCATEEIGPGELWIELDRLGLIFYRTFVVMLNQEHISSFAPQGSSFRLQTDSRRIVRKCAAEITSSLVDSCALTQHGNKFRVETHGCVEVAQGRVVIRLCHVEDPTVVVELGVTGSQFNGFIVIVERTLLIALGKIRVGSIRKQKKAIVAVEDLVMQ